MPSERECVLRERKAFRRGVLEGRYVWDVRASTESYYPLPKVTRPRVVTATLETTGATFQYKVDGGDVFSRSGHSSDWIPFDYRVSSCSPQVLRILADLKENPTETVEDTGDGSSHPSDQ